MKKYLFSVVIFLCLIFVYFISYYIFGFYINFDKNIESFTASDNQRIYVNGEEFIIKGVDMGSGIPGHFATDYAINKETYLRWFKYIEEMGANTIRVYTILSPEFYEAFYEYNQNNTNPLYLLHGVWIDDYKLNSQIDALNSKFQDQFLKDTKTMIDVIHGRKYISPNNSYSSGLYNKDISNWVIGYIVGVEWEPNLVSYTDNKYKPSSYTGKYLSTKENTSPFVNMLAYVGDESIKYESKKYNSQRLFAYSNWPTTDPFQYSDEAIVKNAQKYSSVDIEDITFNDDFIGGTFASYHVYPYYPDYLNYEEDKSKYIDKEGNINTYYAYLKMLNDYHTIPVVISEFGVSTGRGMAQIDENTGLNQGHMTEEEQGQALISMYNDIIDAGSAGGIVFTWQDEWFKRTWNTMQNVDLSFTPYWSDAQTNEQYFGLMSFEPGNKESISYVDGDINEWSSKDIVSATPDKNISLKYDEKYIYLMARINNYNEQDKVYIPLDITPNSGSKTTNISKNTYNRDIDFLIEIDGQNNSRIYVQEYYNALLAIHSESINGNSIYFNPPTNNTNKFNKIELILKYANTFGETEEERRALTYETGKLRHGNANPQSSNYDSLADFIINGEYIEIRIPWQMLNFSNPSKMSIHDDYYKNYGIENLKINKIYVGIGQEQDHNIDLKETKLKGWGTKVTYHERLKNSYYILKEHWTGDNS